MFFKKIILLLVQVVKNHIWKEAQAVKATNEPINKFNHGIDAVRYEVLARVIARRKRMVKVGRVR